MPVSSPNPLPRYPPRAGKLWVGRRAKVAVQAERTGSALYAVLRWFFIALIPGLPFVARGKRALGLIVLGAYLVSFARFIVVHQIEGSPPVNVRIPLLMAIQFDPSYIWCGLAAGIHIVSVNEHIRPWLQGQLSGVDLPARILLTLAATLLIAAFVYVTLYAPLL